MRGPEIKRNHPCRRLDCEAAMEENFKQLVEEAEAAGWRIDEVAEALHSLADSYMLAASEDQHADPDERQSDD